MDRIVICVCTRQRPKMLSDCLFSLMKQETPPNVELHAVVIDNEALPNNREEVAHFAAGFPYPLHYRHEPRTGISQARNAALQAALELGANWIAFIDDDEIAPPEWITEMHAAAYRHGRTVETSLVSMTGEKLSYEAPVDVVHGVIKYQFPVDAAKWRCKAPWGDWGTQEGKLLDTAGTGNILFSTRLVRKHNLRFDESLGLRGGEDVAFFKRMHDNGAVIVLSLRGVVTEQVPWERITLLGHIRKSYRSGICKIEGAQLVGQYNRSGFIRKAVRKGLAALLRISLAVPAVLIGRGTQTAFSGVRSLALAYGMIVGICGGSFEYYKKVEGH